MSKNVFFYWGGNSPISFLRYLTIVSFKQYNPDYKIHFYLSKKTQKDINWGTHEQSDEYTGKDYTEECKQICDVVESFDMEEIGFSNDLAEVHKSDIIRVWLMLTKGGIWSDMDIIYFDKVPEYLENTDFVSQHPIEKYYNIGFIGGVRESIFYRNFFEKQKNVNVNILGYQKYGTTLLNSSNYTNINILDMDTLYYFDSTMIPTIFNTSERLSEKSFGIHWYAGSSFTREWENKITADNYKNFNNVIGEKLKNIKL